MKLLYNYSAIMLHPGVYLVKSNDVKFRYMYIFGEKMWNRDIDLYFHLIWCKLTRTDSVSSMSLKNFHAIASVAKFFFIVPALQALSLPEHQTVKATCSFLVSKNLPGFHSVNLPEFHSVWLRITGNVMFNPCFWHLYRY